MGTYEKHALMRMLLSRNGFVFCGIIRLERSHDRRCAYRLAQEHRNDGDPIRSEPEVSGSPVSSVKHR